MAAFFVRRPTVAIVISIVLVIAGLVLMRGLPIEKFPDITPPQVQVSATYVGADAVSVEESVATPIEQQVNGVDRMIYMQSTNANDGSMTLNVSFEVGMNPDIAQVLVQNRVAQAQARLPPSVSRYGLTVKKRFASPLHRLWPLFAARQRTTIASSPTMPPSTSSTSCCASPASVTWWCSAPPATRCASGSTPTCSRTSASPSPICSARCSAQSTINPAGQIGGEPVPPGQVFTYTIRAQGRLSTVKEFGNIIVRANPDGSFLRLKDVGRIELGTENYTQIGRFKGKNAAVIAVYQLPGANALDTVKRVNAVMAEAGKRFPADITYGVGIDSTLPVSEGIREIVITLVEALALVIVVVFIFLQSCARR